jgi:ParB family chromosome partitioning protein
MLQESTDVVFLVPLGKILSDDDFNCRGRIAPIDVLDLAQNIAKNGLQQPIIIEPHDKQPPYEYRIIAGHRRYKATKLNEAPTIKAIIRTGLTEEQALILNLSENLKRRHLNIMQEAKACNRLRNQGLKPHDIAQELNVSHGWVNIRLTLLTLPEEVQEAAAGDLLNQSQIKTISEFPTKTQMFEAVRKVKDAKLNGDAGKIQLVKIKPKNPLIKKPRNRAAVCEMLEHIQDHIGNSFATRCLAWAAGEISDMDLYQDIDKIAKEDGRVYEIPKEFVPGVL